MVYNWRLEIIFLWDFKASFHSRLHWDAIKIPSTFVNCFSLPTLFFSFSLKSCRNVLFQMFWISQWCAFMWPVFVKFCRVLNGPYHSVNISPSFRELTATTTKPPSPEMSCYPNWFIYWVQIASNSVRTRQRTGVLFPLKILLQNLFSSSFWFLNSENENLKSKGSPLWLMLFLPLFSLFSFSSHSQMLDYPRLEFQFYYYFAPIFSLVLLSERPHHHCFFFLLFIL